MSLIFLSILIVLIIAITICINEDSGTVATWFLVAGGVGFYFIDTTKFMLLVSNINYLIVIGFMIIYLTVGIIWSFIKLYLDVKDRPGIYKERSGIDFETIARYICYWPFSMLLIILQKPLQGFLKLIHRSFNKTYEKIIIYALKTK